MTLPAAGTNHALLFMKAKTNLKKLIDDTITDNTSKKSAYARLTASVARLTPEQLEELQAQSGQRRLALNGPEEDGVLEGLQGQNDLRQP